MRLSLLIGIIMLLSGCASSSFDCPRKDGVACSSLYEVNDMINKGAIDKDGLKKKSKLSRSQRLRGDNLPKTTISQLTTAVSVNYNKVPVRVPEKTVSIVIYPYESMDGVYHQGTVLYTVLSKARWVG